MSDDIRDEVPPQDPGESGALPPAVGRQASIERRREALRVIGRAGAVAGAASPLAALAGSNGRPWAKNKFNTKKVHATISGCNSVLMSAEPTKQVYGKPCTHYGSSGNLPSGCKDSYNQVKKFKDVFSCSGAKDSNGRYLSDGSCLFHKSITDLCNNYQGKPETVWITAYCNASAYWHDVPSMCKFPYKADEVKNFWTSDVETRTSAHDFFKIYMMNG